MVVFNHKHRAHAKLLMRQEIDISFHKYLLSFSEEATAKLFIKQEKENIFMQVGIVGIAKNNFACAINNFMIYQHFIAVNILFNLVIEGYKC